MQFELITLSGTKYSGDVAEVSLPTAAGQISVLPHHEALTSVVDPGPIVVRTKGAETQTFVSYGGLIDVSDGAVRVLADEAEHIDELIEEDIAAALAAAEELRKTAKTTHEIASATRIIDRQSMRLNVARRHHRRSL